MHPRAASRREEAASGLHSPQDKCQGTLPVMDAGAWQALTQGSCSARPLGCSLGAPCWAAYGPSSCLKASLRQATSAHIRA